MQSVLAGAAGVGQSALVEAATNATPDTAAAIDALPQAPIKEPATQKVPENMAAKVVLADSPDSDQVSSALFAEHQLMVSQDVQS